MDQNWFVIKQQEQRRRGRAAVKAFVEAVVGGDTEAMPSIFKDLDETDSWRGAFRAVSKREPKCSRAMQEAFVGVVVRHGDTLRDQVSDDKLLVGAFRLLLPPYGGPATWLFRGDSLWNRKRRTYGLSWTDSAEEAKNYATWLWQTCEGGSVVLRTFAPPTAIICAVHEYDNSYCENEYLVDRRLLTHVDVVARFPQLRPDQTI